MSERYDQEIMLGYIEGELTDEQRVEFERQMAEDSRLRLLVEQMMGDRNMLRGGGQVKAPGSLMDQVNLRLERNMLLDEPGDEVGAVNGGSGRWRIGRWAALSGMAAMVLIGVTVAIFELRGPTLVERMQQDESQALAMGETSRAAGVKVGDELVTSESSVKSYGVSKKGVVKGKSADESLLADSIATDTLGRREKLVKSDDVVLRGRKAEAPPVVSSSPESKRAEGGAEFAFTMPDDADTANFYESGRASAEAGKVKVSEPGGEAAEVSGADEMFNELREMLAVDESSKAKPNAALDIYDERDFPELTESEVAVVEQAIEQMRVGVGLNIKRAYEARLEVLCDDAMAVRGRLIDWAHEHHVGIQSLLVSRVAVDGGSKSSDGVSQRVVLILESGQLPGLIKFLDSESQERVVVRSERGWWNTIVSEQRRVDHLWMMQGSVEFGGEGQELEVEGEDTGLPAASYGRFLHRQLGVDGYIQLYGSKRILVVEIEVKGRQ